MIAAPKPLSMRTHRAPVIRRKATVCAHAARSHALLPKMPHSQLRMLKPRSHLESLYSPSHLRFYRPSRKLPIRAVQANLISRMIRVFTSYVSQIVGSFEDPERVLDRVVEEMQEDLIRMRQATAQVIASERQMNAKYSQAQKTADEWLKRAELAVSKGQDDLAREALKRRKAFQENADKLRTQLDAQTRATEQLQANARTLESKLAEAKNKKETLKARAAAAKSSQEIQEMIGGLRLNSSSAWAAFDKMEEKVVALEASAEQAAMLSTPDSLEQKFAQLEYNSVDDELSALKKGTIKAGSPVGVLTEGRSVKDFFRDPAIDRELMELRERARR